MTRRRSYWTGVSGALYGWCNDVEKVPFPTIMPSQLVLTALPVLVQRAVADNHIPQQPLEAGHQRRRVLVREAEHEGRLDKQVLHVSLVITKGARPARAGSRRGVAPCQT